LYFFPSRQRPFDASRMDPASEPFQDALCEGERPKGWVLGA
jgi:hypothetical protein